jgi:hypothetical protein
MSIAASRAVRDPSFFFIKRRDEHCVTKTTEVTTRRSDVIAGGGRAAYILHLGAAARDCATCSETEFRNQVSWNTTRKNNRAEAKATNQFNPATPTPPPPPLPQLCSDAFQVNTFNASDTDILFG